MGFFADDRIEPTVVKNLENVQGDERDLMMFSITFAELIGLVRDNRELTTCNDPAVALGRETGLARLAQGARARLEEAIRIVLNSAAWPLPPKSEKQV